MTRRLVLFVIAVVFLAPLHTAAQSAGKVHRIGVLSYGSSPPGPLEVFRKGLQDAGYVEGRNLVLEWRFADGDRKRLAHLADELVRLKVDVIFAVSTPAAQAAKRATGTVPIVIARVADPVKSGLVASIGRPGGNVTGLSSTFADLSGKRLELLREAVPGLSRAAVMWNTGNQGAALAVAEHRAAGARLGVDIHVLDIRHSNDIDDSFEAAHRARAGAVIIMDDVLFAAHKAEIVELAAKYSLPLVSAYSDFVKAGGFMAYGPSESDTYKRAAQYVDRILRGTQPGDLPVEQPAKYELVLNLKTARALGLALPPSLLLRADQVIE